MSKSPNHESPMQKILREAEADHAAQRVIEQYDKMIAPEIRKRRNMRILWSAHWSMATVLAVYIGYLALLIGFPK